MISNASKVSSAAFRTLQIQDPQVLLSAIISTACGLLIVHVGDVPVCRIVLHGCLLSLFLGALLRLADFPCHPADESTQIVSRSWFHAFCDNAYLALNRTLLAARHYLLWEDPVASLKLVCIIYVAQATVFKHLTLLALFALGLACVFTASAAALFTDQLIGPMTKRIKTALGSRCARAWQMIPRMHPNSRPSGANVD